MKILNIQDQYRQSMTSSNPTEHKNPLKTVEALAESNSLAATRRDSIRQVQTQKLTIIFYDIYNKYLQMLYKKSLIISFFHFSHHI